MRWKEITGQKILETCTAGATSAGNVATVVGNMGTTSRSGAIGTGFDPNGHMGIYDTAERKKKRAKK